MSRWLNNIICGGKEILVGVWVLVVTLGLATGIAYLTVLIAGYNIYLAGMLILLLVSALIGWLKEY